MGDTERFARFVERAPSGCWLWTGGLYPNGYAKFKVSTGESGGRSVLAHRHAYMAARGPIAGVINHLCEVKRCVNPVHMEDVTQAQNVHYSLSDACVRGHSLAGSDVYTDRIGKRHCNACRRARRAGTPRLGDIGEPLRHIEIEPLPRTEPMREPSPEPVRVPEEVPA